MKIFSAMYDRCLRWAAHKHAVYYLGGMSIAESVFFPIPVDVMLAPMALANRNKAWFYATVCTLTSVVGGLIGYWLGAELFDVIFPYIESMGYAERLDTVKHWMNEYGWMVVFIAGFSPVPYKLFTVSAGVIGMALLPFLFASVIGRAARFYLVAGLMYWGGDTIERRLKPIIDWLGWSVILLAVFGYLLYKYL
ncbi:YqaA family protein [Pleionea litopenaei]|uniref:YqaA family protein n=1 Tax=Pleionea litopenaei TaxID=3070815 RepID=A0AA51RVQ6_9GAMM|nr:YqaA family protein [Pleionea sp. HL-JVS1]WMS88533.1 YqaA family protein [Pleionea sp. HL-JVS1]